jgi:hypothetical protein
MALGDAEQALRENAEARATFEKAMQQVRLMEPTAQEVWIPKVQERLAGL